CLSERRVVTGNRRPGRWLAPLAAGLILGAVETVLAVAFAAFVFGGLLAGRLDEGIGLYLAAAGLTLALFAWRGGARGVVGSVQDAATAVLALVASAAATKAADLARVAVMAGVHDFEAPDIFLTVVAATLVVTVLCGVAFLALGSFRLGNVVRFVPYPVVGGFLAGTGWLLLTGGIYVACGVSPHLRSLAQLIGGHQLVLWLPALAFGVILLVAVRLVRRPMVIPAVIAIGLAVFVIGMLVTGTSIEEARDGRWLLGPFEGTSLWEPWTLRALTGADWSAVLGEWTGIATAVFVAAIAILFNVSGAEVVLDRDLDTNRELRDAGFVNVVSGAIGGIPAYHALSLSALSQRMHANARIAGLIAAAVPLSAVILGATVVELIPRMIVGGVLVFLGLAFIVEWVWDKRRVLPLLEYGVVLVILLTIVGRGFMPGVVLGLVLAVVLFVVSYGRTDLVREVAFGDTYRSNVDRPPAERARLRALADRVQILRVSGFLFFGSTSGLLERIHTRLEAVPPGFVVIDLRRVTGVDSSAVAALIKVTRLAQANAFKVVLTGASDPVRAHLERGDVHEGEIVRFEPDLDRGLQWCEDALLESGAETALAGDPELDGRGGLPPGVVPYLERISVPAGAVLIRQAAPPGDVYVLGSGRLAVETLTPDGTRIRLRTLRPGVVVGEVALYSGARRTADVVAETPSVVLRLSSGSIARMETEEPEVAAALHRWLATTLAERLTETLRAADALLD
ncbi:MAG TPA: SulP family inorganic anion transporter, partial [Actinomycetota bacterium]|nr:SulP family inorganic anion transporter [Actinomycetota bacterium]